MSFLIGVAGYKKTNHIREYIREELAITDISTTIKCVKIKD